MVLIKVDDTLQIRSFMQEDAEALFNAVNNSREHLHPWLNWVDKTTKPEHSIDFIERSIHEQHIQESLALGIVYNGTIIGGVGMHQWELDLKRAQIGYWITKEYQGQGIIHKCLIKFIDFIFCNIGINKLEIRFVPANKRSANVAGRLGFKTEGIIRQSIINNGLTEDLVITGLLKNEWHTAC